MLSLNLASHKVVLAKLIVKVITNMVHYNRWIKCYKIKSRQCFIILLNMRISCVG